MESTIAIMMRHIRNVQEGLKRRKTIVEETVRLSKEVALNDVKIRSVRKGAMIVSITKGQESLTNGRKDTKQYVKCSTD